MQDTITLRYLYSPTHYPLESSELIDRKIIHTDRNMLDKIILGNI